MRLALGITYDGSDYHGWQKQAGLPTVQSALETALSQIAHHPIQVFCAGRTDAGVHAVEQVVHFDTSACRAPSAWVAGTNRYLPHRIAVQWARPVDDQFHARFSACARQYRYLIYNHPVRFPLLTGRVTWHRKKLNVEWMQQAADYLIGEQDFSSFRSAECESLSPFRHVHFCEVKAVASSIQITIEANAFLHHMVRNIVGVLMVIGEGAQPPEWMATVLAAKDRRAAAKTALPDGLYLYRVKYDADNEAAENSKPYPDFF